jgi:hypothetical protein
MENMSRVVYRSVTGSLAGIDKLMVLAGWYFGRHFSLARIRTTQDLAGTPFRLGLSSDSPTAEKFSLLKLRAD